MFDFEGATLHFHNTLNFFGNSTPQLNASIMPADISS